MFYLTLPSNSSSEFFPENTLTHFYTKLPHSIDLSGGQWEVGLAEIQYPHTWYNIQGEDGWVDFEIGDLTYHAVLRAGYYPTPEILVKRMEVICTSLLRKAAKCDSVEFLYDDITRKVTVGLKPDTRVEFSPLLKNILGFSQDHYEEGVHEAETVVDVRQGFYSLYVYCNVVEPHMVGNVLAPLLRIVPIRGRDGDMITKTYENICYQPVQQKHFDTLEMVIRDDTGRHVSFERGTVVITLHFRQRRSPHFL